MLHMQLLKFNAIEVSKRILNYEFVNEALSRGDMSGKIPNAYSVGSI